MAHFVGIHYTFAFAGVHRQASRGRLWRSERSQVCFFINHWFVSHMNESWIDVHMSISAHAYMHMVCMHTWCSKMFSSKNGTFCWLCQAEYISGGKCLNPEHVSTLVVFVKMELCKSALFMCFLSFQWHFFSFGCHVFHCLIFFICQACFFIFLVACCFFACFACACFELCVVIL